MVSCWLNTQQQAPPVNSPVIGLFPLIRKFGVIDGPLSVRRLISIRREIVALSKSKRTDILLVRQPFYADASGENAQGPKCC